MLLPFGVKSVGQHARRHNSAAIGAATGNDGNRKCALFLLFKSSIVNRKSGFCFSDLPSAQCPKSQLNLKIPLFIANQVRFVYSLNNIVISSRGESPIRRFQRIGESSGNSL